MARRDPRNERRRPGGRRSGEDPSSPRRIEELLTTLQRQTREIRETWQAGDAARLRVLVGQVAALARGAGDARMSESAAELEALLLAEEAETSAMCERVEALIQMCRRACMPSP